jgi:hypothetical protein
MSVIKFLACIQCGGPQIKKPLIEPNTHKCSNVSNDARAGWKEGGDGICSGPLL